MNRRKEITKEDLEKALLQMSRDARRQNKALGLDTLYVKDGYLIKLDPDGNEHRIKKMEEQRNLSPPRVIDLN